ncbi:type II secretion system protein [Candidatus Giovannonibacteria bacterium]|nr:type II secretion system protein [Candidatus Giovannonibacteria bacterium]
MKRGFTLVEAILYIAILGILGVSVVNLILTSSATVRQIRSERRIASVGEAAMENLVREIRQASDVLDASSVFSSNPGILSLRTVSFPGSSTVITRTFSLGSGRLQKQDDLGSPEYITPPEASISQLVFWHSATSTSDLISFQLTVDSKNFYGSAVLRSKY